MIIDNFDRCTGRTTRLVLNVVSSLSEGKSVLLICPTGSMASHIKNTILNVIDALGCKHEITRNQGSDLEFVGSKLKIVSVGSLETLKGCSLDKYFVDAGSLTVQEQLLIAPMIRSKSMPMNVDVTYVDFEFELDNPEQEKRATRILSSR